MSSRGQQTPELHRQALQASLMPAQPCQSVGGVWPAMLRTLSVLHIISLSALLVPWVSSKSSKETPSGSASSLPRPPSPLGDSSWALGLRLYKSLRSSGTASNTLFSPLLLASSLGALSRGAGGATSSQLQQLLETPSPSKTETQAEEHLAGALRALQVSDGTAFNQASSSAVFTKQGPPVNQAFVKDVQERFGLKHQHLGQGDAKADLKKLNAWAKGGLGGLEGAPLPGDIQAKAGAVILANALHFKGLWEREFNQESSSQRPFLGTQYTQVVMLHRAGIHRFYEDIENMVQVLELRLSGGQASVVLLLPFHVESLARLDKLLTLELLANWLERTADTSTSISLPKANITHTLSLQKQLSALGLTDAWDQKMADFSGLSGKSQGKLHLGGVLHWASLELGREYGKGVPEPTDKVVDKENIKLFYGDHPFVILVRDNTTGALLMMGALDQAEGEALHDEL
ncbi:serine (or cysteine) peptidase inhibitor, clade H, member 2 [Aplochiton taeniatus]